MSTQTIAIENTKTGEVSEAVYEHPLIVRLCHWVNAVSLFVMAGSGLQIFRAFPSFGAKIPQKDLLDWPKSLAIGGWLGGALQWHLTFMWIWDSAVGYIRGWRATFRSAGEAFSAGWLRRQPQFW